MNCRFLLLVVLGCFLVSPFTVRGQEHPTEHPTEHPKEQPAPPPLKKEVTITDISQSLKKYIEEQAKKGGGKFQIKDEDKELTLTLVKIHDDKLTQSENGYYFVCVDFKEENGNIYDMDFFLSGEPGAVKVENTAIHKVNGKPRYKWEQKAGGKYVKVSVPSPSTGK